MDIILLGSGLATAGYLFNQKSIEKDTKSDLQKLKKIKKNLQNNLNDKMIDNFNKSKNPDETNIISKNYRLEKQNNYLERPTSSRGDTQRDIKLEYNNIFLDNKNNKKMITSISGEKIPVEDFKVETMVPFFGSQSKQNTYEYANKPLLENFTGNSDLVFEKSG